MEVAQSTRKISDVATKLSIIELKPLEKKRLFIYFFKICQAPLKLERAALALAPTKKNAYSKKLTWQLSRKTMSRHQLNQKKYIMKIIFKIFLVPLEIRMNKLAKTNKISTAQT